MDFLQNLTNDQTALLGCFVAFVAAMGMLSISFHTNPKNKIAEQEQPVSRLKTPVVEQVEERRKAA